MVFSYWIIPNCKIIKTVFAFLHTLIVLQVQRQRAGGSKLSDGTADLIKQPAMGLMIIDDTDSLQERVDEDGP